VTRRLRCRLCERTQPLAPRSYCSECDGPLDVVYEPAFRHDEPARTPLVHARRLSNVLGVELLLKLEDANPTHSFKDRIASTAVAAAREFGFETLCCASTGNLGEAVAAQAAAGGLEAVVLLPADSVDAAPTSSYGARVFEVDGTFDECRELERQLEELFPWGFLGGNLCALASEGAKTIAYELLEQLGDAPDAVVAPVASGTLLAKLAEGFSETGLTPRLYGAQAGGCPPLAAAWADDRPLSRVRPQTEVRSLAIGDPAYGELAVGAARMSGGAITCVPEEEIADRTALLAETTGTLADSAGGVALGALLELVRTGAIGEGERVVLVVTGTGLTPYAIERRTATAEVDGDLESLLAALGV
jgi:threonine synthase